MAKLNTVMRRFNMKKPKKSDFQVYDKHLDTDGSYKKLGEGTWYNHYMYQRALNAYNIRKSHDGDLVDVRECFMVVKEDGSDMSIEEKLEFYDKYKQLHTIDFWRVFFGVANTL